MDLMVVLHTDDHRGDWLRIAAQILKNKFKRAVEFHFF